MQALSMKISHVSNVLCSFSSHKALMPLVNRTTRCKNPGYMNYHLKMSCWLQVISSFPLLEHLTSIVLIYYDWEKGWHLLLQLALIQLIQSMIGKVHSIGGEPNPILIGQTTFSVEGGIFYSKFLKRIVYTCQLHIVRIFSFIFLIIQTKLTK